MWHLDKNEMKSLQDDSGFTLLELLVVLVILTLIIGLAGPVVLRQFGRAKTDAARVEVERILTDLEFFRVDVGRFPSEAEGLNALLRAPEGALNWQGPYISKASQLQDPWGSQYQYALPNTQTPIVSTFGADGVQGGTGEDQDVSSTDGTTLENNGAATNQ